MPCLAAIDALLQRARERVVGGGHIGEFRLAAARGHLERKQGGGAIRIGPMQAVRVKVKLPIRQIADRLSFLAQVGNEHDTAFASFATSSRRTAFAPFSASAFPNME